MVVIYAEKPDMASKIAAALGGSSFNAGDKKNGYYGIKIGEKDFAVTWGYGHLCALANASGYNEEYKNWRKMPVPFIPEKYMVVLNEKSPMPVKQAYNVVKKLFSDAEYIINATDYDREGELIFGYLYEYMGCRKGVARMKLSSTTTDGIRDAFKNLIPYKKVLPMLNSARCRSIADWVVGCNLTVAMTLRSGEKKVYSIGRVQTPTLAMIVKRDEEIASFKPEPYYTLDAVFTTDAGEEYKGTHEGDRFKDRADAQKLMAKCDKKRGTVTKAEKKEQARKVPNLYNLSLLQMDANSAYGITIKKTLDITQKLYEKGYVTYPRTDCQFLPEDMVGKIEKIQDRLKNEGYAEYYNADASVSNMMSHKSRFFDDKKLGSHFAIVPTEKSATDLSSEEKKIYDLVAYSVIRMLYPDAVIENTKVVTTVEGENFNSSGSAVKKAGWMFVKGSKKETFLPVLTTGQQVNTACSVTDKKTEPPKHYTDKTLLSAMLTAGKTIEDDELKQFMLDNKIEGIGTEATRAAIIENLVARQYVQRDKKNILSTQIGRDLIKTIPIEDIMSVSLTARYEKRLNGIANGQEEKDVFLSDIYDATRKWCDSIMALESVKVKSGEKKGTGLKCPDCGKELVALSWGYGCSGYSEGCAFRIGSRVAGKTLTESQVWKLLETGRIGPLSGFKSKSGKSFEASLVLKKDEEGVTKAYFDFPQSKESEKTELYASCPNCNARIVKGKWGWECEKGCGVKVPYELCKREISKEEAEALLAHGSTAVLDGFISKKGKPFSAGLKMEKTDVKFYFPERN